MCVQNSLTVFALHVMHGCPVLLHYSISTLSSGNEQINWVRPLRNILMIVRTTCILFTKYLLKILSHQIELYIMFIQIRSFLALNTLQCHISIYISVCRYIYWYMDIDIRIKQKIILCLRLHGVTCHFCSLMNTVASSISTTAKARLHWHNEVTLFYIRICFGITCVFY